MLNRNVLGRFQEVNQSHRNSVAKPTRRKESKRDLWDFEEDEFWSEDEMDSLGLDDYEDDDYSSYFI